MMDCTVICDLEMGEIQTLITAVNESKLSQETKHAIRAKLDLMQHALMENGFVSVVTE